MKQTYTRPEITMIVSQLKAIELNGMAVFRVHSEDGLGGIHVQLKAPSVNTWLYFPLAPGEPPTRADLRLLGDPT